jgi:DNA-binding GntR family transcriptional regulator
MESTAPSESLLDVLRRRYALGEITQAQLDEMRQVLGLSEGKAVGTAAGRSNPWEVEHHG